MPPWILVSPASRGIGFTLAQTLLRTTTLSLVATARHSLAETREALLAGAPDTDQSRLHVLPLDVTDEASIRAAASHCATHFPQRPSPPAASPQQSHLHAAFLLPGILYPEKSPDQLTEASLIHTFRVNTIGPLLLLKHFAPFLPRKNTPIDLSAFTKPSNPLPQTHATVLLASARVGSITDNTGLGGWYSYRASKAAVNQVVRTFDNYLRVNAKDRAIAVGYHPGTVRTGLSKAFWANVPEGKLFSVEFAVGKLLDVVGGFEGKAEVGRGRCWDWKGEEVPP